MFDSLQVYQLTSAGDRAVNQDCMAYTVCSEYGLFVVADGLGGHEAGEKASQYFCQGMFKQAPKYQKSLRQEASREQAKDILLAWVDAAIAEMKLLFSGCAEGANAHTTCVILYLDESFSITVHCGDSRVYRLNEREVLWRTKDHSLIQQQLMDGNISEQDMGLHPEQNQLLRSINILKRNQAEVNIYPPIQKGETFVLCTDGFWEFIKEKDLLLLADLNSGRDELRKAAKMMHLRANGKGDNLTAQWVRF